MTNLQSNEDVSKYRLARARESLDVAKVLLQKDKFSDAASNSYFCIFHAIRSVLALEGVDFKKHSAVLSYFRQHYIKTDIFDLKLSKIIDVLFNLRAKSDYSDFFVVSKKEVVEQIDNAEYFLSCVERFHNG